MTPGLSNFCSKGWTNLNTLSRQNPSCVSERKYCIHWTKKIFPFQLLSTTRLGTDMVLVQIRFRSLQTTCQARRWHLGVEIAEIVETMGAIHLWMLGLIYTFFFSQYSTSQWRSLFDLVQDWAKEQKVRRKNVHHDTMFCSSSSCYRARRLHFYKKTRPRSPWHVGPLRAFRIGPWAQFSVQY